MNEEPADTTPAAANETEQTAAHTGEHVAILSIWPAVVGAGVTLSAFGIVTSLAFSIFGIVVFVIGVAGWARELIRE